MGSLRQMDSSNPSSAYQDRVKRIQEKLDSLSTDIA